MDALRDAVFPSVTGILAEVRALVRETCGRGGCGKECTEQIVLAVNEACMNIIQHGYRYAADRTFRISLFSNQGEMVVHLLDNGQPASDSDLRPRELGDLRPGGLGVRFMHEVMDTVGYLPPPEGFANLLQLKKKIY